MRGHRRYSDQFHSKRCLEDVVSNCSLSYFILWPQHRSFFSGHVVTMDCVERIIKKDWIDPTNGAKMTESDIIPLSRGGTGFAAVNDKLKAKLARPVLELA